VDVNLNPLQPTEIQVLQSAENMGTYHVYQETYHPRRYAELHPDGPKADYNWRITAHDRAVEAGMAQLGLGVLLGAHDYRYDITGLVAHARHLLSLNSQLSLSVTLPRMLASPGAPASHETHDLVDDEELKFIVAITRLALPNAAIVMCTPAERETRIALYGLGVSEVSVGSLSYPGTYTEDGVTEGGPRLRIGRPRALEVLVYRMCAAGFVPDICAGDTVNHYRVALKRARGEQISPAERRTANSLLGLREYLMDYASPETARLGEAVIQRELAALPADLREMTLKLMEEAEAGLRGQIF
jgi:2-iminoacetate synthase